MTLMRDGETKNFFNDNLPHFAGARTHPYAIQCASAICKDFKLSIAGQRRLNKALNDLPCINTPDDGLAFGWSMEHIIRSPRVHTFGYEHLTIAITLTECFHETYAAEVFHQLAKRALPKSQIKPHLSQWLDLLHFVDGLFATTEFGLAVENYILLDPFSVMPGGKFSSERCLTPVESLADALIAMSELTSGKRKQLTLRGGGVIGYLAGLAEQFFDLTVTMESRQGQHLHGVQQGAQLTLIYTDNPSLIIEDGSTAPLVREVSNISIESLSSQIHFLPYGGRVAWESLLPQVFGRKFQEIEHNHSKSMYTAIGAAFRSIEDAKDSSSISVKKGPHASLAVNPPSPSATRLITLLTTYITGLQRGQGRMERQLKLSPTEAAKVHFQEIHHLATACKCIVCASASDDGRSASSAYDASTAGYCIPAIVESTILMGLMLSRIVLAHPLDPSREGIQLLYKTRADKFMRTKDHNNLAPSPNAVATLYDNVLDGPTSQVLRMAVKFFAGGHLPPLGSDMLPTEVVAISHEGVCAFAAELAAGRGVRKDMQGMIRVVNGGFGIGSKSYRLAAWSAQCPGGRESWTWEEVEVEHLKGLPGGKVWMK